MWGMSHVLQVLNENWTRLDSTTHVHKPSGMHVHKMADNTWSISTGPVEDMPTGQSKWLSHYHRTLNDAKSTVGFMHYRNSKKM
jgi:hypothetical protein